jgi:hypothetical protein
MQAEAEARRSAEVKMRRAFIVEFKWGGSREV